MATYRLGSNGLVHTPGLLLWAINGAKFKKDRKKMVNLFSEGYGLPKDAATALVAKGAPYTVVGETVVFTYPAEQ